MSRLVFVNRFYWPEEPATAQLLTDMAEAMAAAGHQVVVITSQPARQRLPAVEQRHGVEVRRVRGTKFGNRNILFQACDFATYSLRALWSLATALRRGDTLILMTDPPLLAIPAVPLARLRGARVIHWLQDIYPEAAILLTGRTFLRVLRPLRDRAWRAAEACVVLGDDMAALPRAAGVSEGNLHFIPNWAPTGVEVVPPHQASRLRADWGLEGKFVVAYFGNLGRVHDLDPVLDVAEALRDDRRFQFVFIGPGAQRIPLEAAARHRKLGNVRFFPAQPRERRTEILALGDVHLVTLREGGERVVFPSKLYGICAAGRPVLFIGPRSSEIAQLIVERSLGLAFSRAEIAAIAAGLRTLCDTPAQLDRFGASGRSFYEHQASTAQAAARWTHVLDVVHNHRAR